MMQPKTLELATKDKVIEHRELLMGYSEQKNTEYVKVFDNWVNRIAFGYPLRMRYNPPVIHSKRQVATMNALFPFQREDVLKMASHDYFLNRNKMGAGKTIEFIATCILLDAESVLVSCPKTLQTQWVEKFKEWWPERADDVKVYEFGYEPKRGDILMVNAEKLISKKANGKFDKFVWDVFGVDEAHSIKNRNALRTRATKHIPAKHRYPMTGTPLLKSPDDLYSLFEFLNPEIAGASYWRFTEYFCKIVEDFYGRRVAGLTTDTEHVVVLRKILDTVSCYNEIKTGQQKRIINVPLTMESRQRTLYRKILKVALDELPPGITIPNGAVKATRLIQTTSCPRIFNSKEVEGKSYIADYPWGIKFDFIADMLENNPEVKIVVFSKLATVVNKLEEFLDEKGIDCATYTGQQSVELREEHKSEFIRLPNVRVLAGTIDALGTGVDGLQDVCYTCVFIDRDVRPTINEQCEARLHRTGQKHEVLCYYLTCEKSIDKHIDKLNMVRSDDLRKLLEEDVSQK